MDIHLSNNFLRLLFVRWSLWQRKVKTHWSGMQRWFSASAAEHDWSLICMPGSHVFKESTDHIREPELSLLLLQPSHGRRMMVRWFREPTQQTVIPCWFSVTSLLEMRWAAVQTERRWDHRCHSLAWAAVGTQVGLNLSRSGPERMSTIYLVQIFLMPSDLFNTISCLLLIQDTLDRFLCKCMTYVMMHPIYFSQDYPLLGT